MHEDFVELLTKYAHQRARDANERLGFVVYVPGTTFGEPGKSVELHWGNRVAWERSERIDYNRKLGKLDDFARHTIGALAGRTVQPRPAEVYRFQDVLRERYFSLLRVLRAGAPNNAKDVERRVETAVKNAAEGEKLGDVAAFRVRLDVIEEEIVNLFPKKRGRKAKEEASV